jgi:hypothetical protein
LNNAKGSGDKGKIGRSGGCKVYWPDEEKSGGLNDGEWGLAASAAIRDEFMAEEKSSCRWLL